MAAKSKKRLHKIENKLAKLEKLELNELICSICQSILIEPVTLPCFHDFCLTCFNGSVENNALCCPLCRLRIGSWLRTATKQDNLVNKGLWIFIQSKFSNEITEKLKGNDVEIPEDKPILRLSAPGEIKSEYEAELLRLRNERLQIEQKQIKETELLVKKIQDEEKEAHQKYLERLKQDEILAKQIQQNTEKVMSVANIYPHNVNSRRAPIKNRVKVNKIDSYLCKRRVSTVVKDSPLLTDDNSTDSSTPKVLEKVNRSSPEMVPTYSRYLKTLIDKKIKTVSSLWNKENGRNDDKIIPLQNEKDEKVNDNTTCSNKLAPGKTVVHSLPVSLPFKGVLKHNKICYENRQLASSSVDSMMQELCYFKPIEGIASTSYTSGSGLPLRVPCVRVEPGSTAPCGPEPSRAQLLDGLCRLRRLSLANNLPSSFAIALGRLTSTKETSNTKNKSCIKKNDPTSPCISSTYHLKRNTHKSLQIPERDGCDNIECDKALRRTRSMGSISKLENETTPKKAKIKDRKVSSERKRNLRSDSKKSARKSLNSLNTSPEVVNNNKVNLVMKKLSSPLENCDVKHILEEQLRIERMIEQEKKDMELARKVHVELNGGRQLRRSAVKRQVMLNYALRPAKKLKV